MSAEEWRPIPGFPRHAVSSEGRFRPHADRDDFLAASDLATDTDGYPRMWVSDGTKAGGRHMSLHTAVMLAFCGPRPDGLVTRHLNGIKTDARVANLTYGTHSENMQDMLRLGEHYLASRTICKRGHELSPENTRVEATSRHRHCRTCDRTQQSIRRRKQRAAAREARQAA